MCEYSTVMGKMDVRQSLVVFILFHMLVAWCSAKHISILNEPSRRLVEEVQDSIQNLIHTGIYSHLHLDTSQVQVATPVKVSREGSLLSRRVEHAHEHGHPRARRDIFGRDHEMSHSLHYNLTVDGRELRLDLRPSVSFITPALIVERRRAGERTRSRPQLAATDCHYTGSVRGQPASAIALSACDGLAGLLRTDHGEYWIEPSKNAKNDESEGRPHVIFKRSAVDKVQAFHRAKRALENEAYNLTASDKRNNNMSSINSNRNVNFQQNHSREAIEKRKKEHYERLRRLEALRNDPTEYRRQQNKSLRIQQRKMQSTSKSTSQEGSKSRESSENKIKNRNKLKNERRERRKNNKNKRKRRKREKNCATIQPPYQWNSTSTQTGTYSMHNNKQNHRYEHHHSHRPDYDGARRPTRSVSRPRHVEVLLVADKSMTDFHNEGSLETYLLTIMNMVSSLYMDPSIGNYIKVVVVKIILVEEGQAEPDLYVSRNADETLRSFCSWQRAQNPTSDEDPHHHDVAILVTRQDICSQNDIPCSTLGVAHVAGMCRPDRSCSVNEDNGIMLAHTITHELGHNFGLYHDTEKIGCHRRDGSTLHIMTPYFEADTVQVAWSRCSKRDVTMFLDAGMGECLGDQPSKVEYLYPEMPAGAMFDAEIQCRLQFGVEAAVCSEPSRMCEQLWCLVNGTCKSMLRPPAPGTTCGEDMWCENQQCVVRSPSPAPRDGGWGAWGAWSACSRSCGAGVSTQTRECNSPAPTNNGKYCIGDRSRYKICNTDPCPINMPSFREVQCSKYNNITYNNETVAEWIPYFDQDRPCELQCVPRNNPDDEGGVGGIVADGTPCRQSAAARDRCIAGVCYRVGCDWVVDSAVEEDACGECGGDGSACKTVQGIYTKGTTKQNGFSEVAVIPAGSRNVKIEEKVNPGNYISIGSAKSRKVYFNGARNETLTEYFVAGSQAIYERDRDWEKVRIPGPIAEDIKVYQRIFRGKHRNPGVTYQYTVDRQSGGEAARFHYRLSEWSPCSASCGRGYMRRHHECLDHNMRVVDPSRCYHIEPPRNEALIQHCVVARCQVAAAPAPNARALHVSAAVHSPDSRQSTKTHSQQQPASTHSMNSQQLSVTHSTRSQQPAATHSTRYQQPAATHSTRSQQPAATHSMRSQQPAAMHSTRYQQPAATHSTRSQQPAKTRSTRYQQNAATHSTRSQQPPKTHSTRYQQNAATHSTRSQQPAATHSTLPKQPAATHFSHSQQRPAALRSAQRRRRPPAQRTYWWVGAWNTCSKTCHMPGDKPTKHRSVYCVNRNLNKVVNDSACDAAMKPITSITCADVPPC